MIKALQYYTFPISHIGEAPQVWQGLLWWSCLTLTLWKQIAWRYTGNEIQEISIYSFCFHTNKSIFIQKVAECGLQGPDSNNEGYTVWVFVVRSRVQWQWWRFLNCITITHWLRATPRDGSSSLPRNSKYTTRLLSILQLQQRFWRWQRESIF